MHGPYGHPDDEHRTYRGERHHWHDHAPRELQKLRIRFDEHERAKNHRGHAADGQEAVTRDRGFQNEEHNAQDNEQNAGIVHRQGLQGIEGEYETYRTDDSR